MTAESEFNIAEFLPYLLNQAAEQSSLDFQAHYKSRYGMLRTEWRVLFHLGKHGSMTARDVALVSKMHKTKISRAVYQLRQKRYVVRDQDEDDRRVEHLSLTPAGQQVYRELVNKACLHEQSEAGKLTKKEMTALKVMLKKIAGVD